MSSVDPIGVFDEHSYPLSRTATLDTLRWGRKRFHIPLMVEVDVTRARDAIRREKELTGEGKSFTGWIIACLGRAVSEHPHVHALRKRRSKLILFHDVDVAIVIERAVSTAGANKTLPMPYVIRSANTKSVAAIHAEIREAQKAPVASGQVQVEASQSARMIGIFNHLPAFARDLLVWRRLQNDPFYMKRMMGTVGVTAIGMAGHGGIGWGIPLGIHPLVVAVGGISPRPYLTDGQLTNREHLALTVLFDHTVTDGAPVARFVGRLQDLMEDGYGLEDGTAGTHS
jgi:pyruvate/2-oxoglutarate dehydrogenase complex dihydrolipoamide acyltransferase (E2) component